MGWRISEQREIHQPVLLREVIHWLRPEQGGTFIDCTLGLGGHAEAMLDASGRTRLIGLDRDPEALELARSRLGRFGERVQTVHASFANLLSVTGQLGVTNVRGVLADLGVSSLQLDQSERGFSFASDDDSPLDMRMDPGGGETAAELVNRLTERELADLIFEYGEERGSRKIARRIVRERDVEPVTGTKRLADIVIRALNVRGRWRIHPATRTFLALRIAVNGELDALSSLIPAAIDVLVTGGRLAIISFHSLEDRIAKRAFQRESGRCVCEDSHRGRIQTANVEDSVGAMICRGCGAQRRVAILTRKPVRPAEDEVARNPRSRSALLRVCEKL